MTSACTWGGCRGVILIVLAAGGTEKLISGGINTQTVMHVFERSPRMCCVVRDIGQTEPIVEWLAVSFSIEVRSELRWLKHISSDDLSLIICPTPLRVSSPKMGRPHGQSAILHVIHGVSCAQVLNAVHSSAPPPPLQQPGATWYQSPSTAQLAAAP